MVCLLYFIFFIFIIFFIVINSISLNKVKCPSNYKLISSGSSDNHFHLLLLFLHRIYIVENNICVVIWNLGLSYKNIIKLENAKKYIERKNIIVDIMVFNYTNYPQHFNIEINAGYYSWKPFVIWDTYIKYKRTLLWLDCGCFIYNKLDYEYQDINRNKIYTINATCKIKRCTHYKSLELFNVNESLYNKVMCAAGIFGLAYRNDIINRIMNIWKACALIKNCISPPGARKGNHLQDQSILSILLYQNNINFYNNKRKDFSIHFDKRYKYYNDSSFLYFLKII